MEIIKANLSHNFLKTLKDIPDPPRAIWQRGTLPEGARPKVVSIVGSRKNTKYGEEVAYKLAYELAKNNVVIVSGLAYGIDACAHRGCLDAGGITVAVLGTPIDHIYPTTNSALAENILKNGAIISEYASGADTYRCHFTERNRLVSGLSDALVVVEAGAKSGTLTTAAHAIEQGRDVFAVPGDITRPMSVTCNRLIKQGAIPFTETEDILGILFPKKAKQLKFEVFGDTVAEQGIISAIKQGIKDGEKIISHAKLSVSEFNQTATILEIKGIIRSLGGNYWSLV